MTGRGLVWIVRPAVVCSLLAVLLTTVVLLQGLRDRWFEASRQPSSILYLSSGPLLQRMALSFDALLADVYWIRAIQHYGGARLADESERSYDLLYPLLDIVTDLDPRFNVAYRFGAIFLTEAYPDGPGRPTEAVALLEKGVQAMPERWEYLQDIGFVYYWWLHDYPTAASWFERASHVPGAPWWLGSLAANTLAVGGNRAGSRRLWLEMYQTADNEWVRAESQRRLLQLDALDQIDDYTRRIEQFEARVGRRPRVWAEVVPGTTAPAPIDPAGFPYLLNLAGGSLLVAPASPLYPLPAEPPGGPPS